MFLLRLARRLFRIKAERTGRPAPYYRGLEEITGQEGKWSLEERWLDVRSVLDLRPSDTVLDVGCAEGLLTLEVGKLARSVRGVDVSPARIETARRLAGALNVRNVTFEVGSITDMVLEPLSYDVVLFLGVIHHLPPATALPSLEKVLRGARRQVIVRTPLRHPKRPFQNEIIPTCERHGFSTRVLYREGRGGDLVVADRRLC